MKKTQNNLWLCFDIYNLAYRAFHTSGHLSYGGDPTGTLYGVFREIMKLQDRFGTHLCAFAFDLGRGKREEEYPYYKLNRRRQERPEGFEESISEMKSQIERLRQEYLEQLGYPNVFYQVGYEADDVIASLVDNLPPDDELIIVSGDEDLYQLLCNRVMIYQPRNDSVWTKEKFKKSHNMKPNMWPVVKALAGCKTDNIPGVDGVGEITAIKYINNPKFVREELRKKIDLYQLEQQFHDNLKLVTLPYPGTNPFKLIEHQPPTKEAWKALMEKLGMATLADHDPSAVCTNLFSGR